MKKINASVISGLFILLVSVIFLIEGMKYKYTNTSGPGPGFFPVWLSSIMIIISILYIFTSLKGKDVVKNILPGKEALIKIASIIGSMVLFIILMKYVGFILGGTIFLFILLFKSYKWYISLTISIGTSLFLFWLFQIMLKVQLPTDVFLR